MTSAPSTCCTRPPGPRPNAATPCSRPPSRHCAESASAPGASARSPPPPSFCSTVSTTAPHDQQASGAVTGNGSVCTANVTAASPVRHRHFAGSFETSDILAVGRIRRRRTGSTTRVPSGRPGRWVLRQRRSKSMPIPYDGDQLTLHNPDGTELSVRAWGNQFAAVFEIPEGYTIVQDPDSGYWQYATLSPDKQELLPTTDRVGAVDPAQVDLPKHIRPQRGARGASARAALSAADERPRWEVRREQRRARSVRAAQAGPASAPPQEGTTGHYVGLCLLVEFPDVPATITRQQVDDFCNKIGYAEFGNNGSVRDYFAEVSGGKLTYTNIGTAYYRAKHERAYYTDETIQQPLRARELITEALDDMVARGFDFSPLTTDDAGYVRALNVFYTGRRVNNWAKGLWPHSWHMENGYQVTPTKQLYDYQITDLGDRLTLRTFCHENGHMICDYRDMYDYDRDPAHQGNGIGHYCLMCFGGSDVNPVHVSAYLKHASGWASSVS